MHHLGDSGNADAVGDLCAGGHAFGRHELHYEVRQVLHEFAVEFLDSRYTQRATVCRSQCSIR